jgi:hypothetical protein
MKKLIANMQAKIFKLYSSNQGGKAKIKTQETGTGTVTVNVTTAKILKSKMSPLTIILIRNATSRMFVTKSERLAYRRPPRSQCHKVLVLGDRD